VIKAGSNPRPPIVVGVGIGGTMEKAALISKEALLREPLKPNDDKHIAELEQRILNRINQSDIGPAGLGGKTTALAVYIETYPTHIAGLPVAVSISCHAIRHLERTL
jgi:fumarate hydratase subunit alpha